MKKKILGGIAVLAIVVVAVINVNLGAKSNDLSDLSLANVEALAYEFNNQNWDFNSHWYNTLGGSWTPTYHSCTYSINTGGSVGISGGSVSWGGSTTTYSGHMVTCTNGNGNCVNGTGCIPDSEPI
jgi:hypothetical protein